MLQQGQHLHSNGTEDTSYLVTSSTLLTAFTDIDNSISVTSFVLKANSTSKGTLTGPNSSGDYSFVPTSNFNGQVNFKCAVRDGSGAIANADIILNIDSVNDAPALTGIKATLNQGLEDTNYSILKIDLLQIYRCR